MARNNFTATFDAATELKDAGAVTANGAATVASAARVVNVGPAMIDGMLIVDIDAMDLASADEVYTLILQGSADSTFATGIYNITTLVVGKAALTFESADSTVGRYMLPFLSSKDGSTPLQYMRMFTRVVGTTPSINYRAFITKDM